MSRFALLSLDDPGNFNNDFDNGDDHSDDGNGGSDDGSDDSSDMDIDDDHQAPKYLRGLTGADLDLLMMRRRIESKGTWFMSNLSSASRFYSRRPMNLHPISNGDDTEPVDMLLYVKDIGGASQEQLVERFTNELKNANEYSRDPVYQEDDDDQISYRRIHANPAGFDVLRDFDTMILEVQRMDEALRKADYVNAATELFNRLCDLNGVEAPAKDSAGDTGIQVEIIRYASLYFAGRVRFLRHYIDSQLRVEELNREHFDKTDHPIQPHPFDDQPDWDKESVQLLIADFNSTVHGTNFLQDMRLVEFYANWSEPFMAREQNGHEKFPRITPQLCTYMFERTYCIPVERANLLGT
ncbi:hypothetical protein GGR54DRAFT_71614 [Hypoxylon sp. NC1633]|nr:hypothetical protein GGR54DRAFT_71614 [Hypoxylon sp. NC1633]